MARLQSSNIYWKGLYLENIFDTEIENVQRQNLYKILHLIFNRLCRRSRTMIRVAIESAHKGLPKCKIWKRCRQ